MWKLKSAATKIVSCTFRRKVSSGVICHTFHVALRSVDGCRQVLHLETSRDIGVAATDCDGRALVDDLGDTQPYQNWQMIRSYVSSEISGDDSNVSRNKDLIDWYHKSPSAHRPAALQPVP